MIRWALPVLVASLILSPRVRAISEENFGVAYREKVLPFLESGERFTFPSADGHHALSAVRFIHPKAKGMIVVVNGRSESWLKYGEVFYDLYVMGFSVTSYDHRGQGLSPRLIGGNPQIGYIDEFNAYVEDLNAFVEQAVLPMHPRGKGLFLIAHSMGAVVAMSYLEKYTSPFEGVVLISPMFEINTAPYPGLIARGITGTLQSLGLGRLYAPGEHDRNPTEPFECNKVTGSRSRWEAMCETWITHAEALTGGASISWVNKALSSISGVRNSLSRVQERILILQAGRDQLVMNGPQNEVAANLPSATLVNLPDSKHEILMERDPIRSAAFREMKRFFNTSGK